MKTLTIAFTGASIGDCLEKVIASATMLKGLKEAPETIEQRMVMESRQFSEISFGDSILRNPQQKIDSHDYPMGGTWKG